MTVSSASTASALDAFHYVRSCDLDVPVRVKVCTLEGALPRITHDDLLANPGLKFCGRASSRTPDLIVSAVLVSGDGKRLHVPVATAYKHFTVRFEWNQWLELPLRYSDLPSDVGLSLTLFDAEEDAPRGRRAVGGTTVRLFDDRAGGLFLQGQNDLLLSGPAKESTGVTNGKGPEVGGGKSKDNLQRLTKLAKDHKEGRIPQVDWLDRLTFAEVERVTAKEKQQSNNLFLMVEFPELRLRDRLCGLVYYEKNGDLRNELSSRSDVVRAPDFDVARDNLVEAKHHRLARSSRAGQSERDLKPNAEMRNRLNEVIAYPSTKALNSEEQDNVWRYRYYLATNKKAVAKFVKCINWRSRHESGQALELMSRWAPMDPEDALELLGPNFKHPGVRQYAVERLRQASDSTLQLYLLQLVQALKYEKISGEVMAAKSLAPPPSKLGGGGAGDHADGTKLLPAASSSEDASGRSSTSSSNGGGAKSIDELSGSTTSSTAAPSPPSPAALTGLAAFLIERACKDACIANYLYWYLSIECEEADGGDGQAAVATSGASSTGEDRRVADMYNLVLARLKGTLKSGPQESREKLAFLERQRAFVDRLVQLIKAVHRESGNRQKKIERLQHLLRDTEGGFDFQLFSEPLRLPLDPDVVVSGLVPERATLFKSSLMPARLAFRVQHRGWDASSAGPREYVTLFKHGDDLRQDQLVLQIITLMDKILRQENLDLKLTPYRVLATSSRHGFVQFVDAMPIADILATDTSILNFFKKHAPSESGPYGVQTEVMDTYVKSCAGYCVITFILGVGDRHLDNLLLTRGGNLIHIDFGFILGRDPKMLPPPMKLSREMLEAFGGTASDHYQQFKKECYTAYLSLRRYSNLITNLFSLMVDASVPDIALEPDKTVKKVQEKFKMELSDEEAVGFLESVIDDSAAAVMPAIVDRMHKLAQFMRN